MAEVAGAEPAGRTINSSRSSVAEQSLDKRSTDVRFITGGPTAWEVIMSENLAAGVHRLSAESQAVLARAKARGAAIMARHNKPERLAAATIKPMDPER
jgi:hypothetical protein